MILDLPSVNHQDEEARVGFIDSLVRAISERGSESNVVDIPSYQQYTFMSRLFSFFNESLEYAMNIGNHGGVLATREACMSEFGDGACVTTRYSHAHGSSQNGSFVNISLALIHGTGLHEVCSCSYVVHATLGVHRFYKLENIPGAMLELSDERRGLFESIASFFDFAEDLVKPHWLESLKLRVAQGES